MSPQAPAPHDPVVTPSKPRLWKVLGPGLITGASDDDPSGIATYSQAGAQFGYGLAWTLLLTYPLMVVVQEISARIGRGSGQGIAGNMRKHYPPWLVKGIVPLLLAANVINIGADLSAMSDSLRLLVPIPHFIGVLGFGALSIVLQVTMKYTRYVAVLKWLTLALFAYFGTVLAADVDWGALARGLVVPEMGWSRDAATTIVAVFGTTISPYLFFWQASQEAEDIREHPVREPLTKAPEQTASAVARIRLDTIVGMGFSNVVALAIMVTAAATLNAHGIKDVDSAARAAEALRPVAGDFAFALFALGIIGTGILAVPVLAGSAAYAIGEAARWTVGLGRDPGEAKAFYATVALSTGLGIILNLAHVDSIRALFWSAVINGVTAVPVMVCMMLMATRRRVMGPAVVSRRLLLVGWLTTLLMGGMAVAMMF
ncbi:MAG TPA: divalent metal cation transporter [Magnetospirillum sp.]|jgi:NRAMP (natural resistance-associated macrophage protein)-like metal ion transporter|nr:divalent metal cation transporter [Magnetospirillum sp.]